MSASPYLAAWICAVALTSATLSLVVLVRQPFTVTPIMSAECSEGNHSGNVRYVAIGSSLSAHAFGAPEVSLSSPDAGKLQIWAAPNLSSEAALELLDCALKLPVEAIFLEANTFAFTPLPDAPSGQRRSLDDITSALTALVRSKIESLVGKVVFSQVPIGAIFNLYSNKVWDGNRPIGVRLPEAAVDWGDASRLHDLAAESHTDIVLFEPPRTALYIRDVEEHLTLSVAVQLQQLSRSTGLPVLRFWPAWSDTEFGDYYSHLNAAGSRRFLTEFRAAWREYNSAR